MTTSLPGVVDRIAARDAVSPTGRKLSRLAVDKLGNVLAGFNRHGGIVLSSAVIVPVGEHRCDRQSRLREYEEHFEVRLASSKPTRPRSARPPPARSS